MLCLSGFELYSRWVPLPYHAIRSSGTGGGTGLLYIEKTLKLNSWKLFLNRLNLRNYYYTQAHLLSVLFLFVESQSQQRMVSHAEFFDEFSTIFEPLVSAFGKLLLAGDLNFHVNNPSEGNAWMY